MFYIINCKLIGKQMFNSQDRKTQDCGNWFRYIFISCLVLQKITKFTSPKNENNVIIKMQHNTELLDCYWGILSVNIYCQPIVNVSLFSTWECLT